MSPVWLSGLAAVALVALAALIAGLSGGAGAACAVVAIGAIVVVGWHLLHLDRLLRWAAGPIDAQVPEGRGAWGRVFTALYRRMRLRSARQRDLRLALERFESGAEAMPEGVVVLDGNNRIEWANSRAERASRHRRQEGPRRADRQSRAPAGVRPLPDRRRDRRAAGRCSRRATAR